jgi:hypothetical protein
MKREPVIAKDGLWRLAQIIALIFVSYWMAQGIGAVVKPMVNSLYATLGLIDPSERRSAPPQYRPASDVR